MNVRDFYLQVFYLVRDANLVIDHEMLRGGESKESKSKKHTAASIRWSSPTQLLISRSEAYLWLSGREAEFSTVYGRM